MSAPPNGNFQFSFSRELVSQQNLAGAVVVVFFCHVRASKSKVRTNILLYEALIELRVVHQCTTTDRFLKLT